MLDPFVDDKLTNTLNIATIFQELDSASPAVSWKIYYTLTDGGCDETDGDCGNKNNPSLYPITTFSDFTYSQKYLYSNASRAACVAPAVGSMQAVGDASNSFCIDPTHIAPLSQFFTDMANGTLPSFSYVEAGYGVNDEHPGSGQSIFTGQAEVANILGKFMNSPSWGDSVFFLSYDEGGGPYDHVSPVPGHSNDKTNISNIGHLPLGQSRTSAPLRSIRIHSTHAWPMARPIAAGSHTTSTVTLVFRPRRSVNRRASRAWICRPAGIPSSQYGDIAVHAQALRLACTDGSHRDPQVRREPVHRSIGTP